MRINFHKILIFNILCLSFLSAFAQTDADKILGIYYVKDDVSGDESKVKIYDPWHGKTYKCKMWFENPTSLHVRGYAGIPAFGRTMVLKKVQ